MRHFLALVILETFARNARHFETGAYSALLSVRNTRDPHPEGERSERLEG